MQKGNSHPFQQIYSDQVLQQPMMQAAANQQMPHMYMPNGQPIQQIRAAYPGARMPYQNRQHFVVPQTQEMMHQQNYIQGTYPVNYNGQQYQQYPQYQPHLHQQQQYNHRPTVYVLQNNQNQGNNFNVMQQQIHQNHPTAIPQQRQNLYTNQQQNQLHRQAQHAPQHTPHVEASPQAIPKKRAPITLKDPNTGKDITSEVLKKKEKPAPAATQKSNIPVMTPPTTVVDNDAKLQANAQFAAQVAALSKNDPKSDTVDKTTASHDKEPNSHDNEPTSHDKEPTSHGKEPTSHGKEPTSHGKEPTSHGKEPTSHGKEPTSHGKEPIEKFSVEKEEIKNESTSKPIAVNKTEGKVGDTSTSLTATSLLMKEKEAILQTEKPIVESIETKESVTRSTNIKDSQTDKVDTVVSPTVATTEEVVNEKDSLLDDEAVESAEDSEGALSTLMNGHDSKSAFVAKKKTKKQRLKDLEAKDNSNDLLSAFTDAPHKEEQHSEVGLKSVPEVPKTETTWEDKEKTIDKEVIKNEDVEPEIVQQQKPRIAETKIVNSEEQADVNEEEKLQYDREFLLKFQFAPICTSKPPNLPNIDIVLETAHQPTKPLNPSARNDFMPTFMRQASGGRSSGGGSRSKDRRGPPSMGSSTKKVIQIPQFEKLELKKSENAWVRPKEKIKELSEDDRDRDELGRNVRSILNKLTPQKFKTLVDKMTALKINSDEKLTLSIDLIFEKAISEPGFSVAYANMCRVLTEAFKAVPGTTGEKNQSNIFRKILLNKCQKEFEKDKSDEKLIEEERNKTFDSEQEKKAWLEELDYRELKNRRRTMGNIRFIGELFKLKMISEKIMHECILKLLRNTKQESLEEQMECLCKLLSTIGKDLDHQDAKPRMDQYFQQIHKIMEKKKISSRIRFALRDVIDLRKGGWVPRRDEGNPKTIDQIHREAQQKEKEAEIQRQQDKLKRSDPRNRGGGRDSPVIRPSGNNNADGWTNVPMKTTRSFAPTPVDASKFKIKKNDSSDISLGPGGRPGAWSRGASGGTNSRSGSGSNTPTPEIEQKTNRYDLLSESSSTPTFTDVKRGGPRQSNSVRKQSQGTNGSRRGVDDKIAVVRAVKDFMSTGSRNQSPVRSGDSSRNSPSSSGAQTPADSQSLSPNPNSVDEYRMRKITKSTVEEFFGCGDYKEAILCIKELNAPQLHNIFVEEAIVIATEKKPEHRILAGQLICRLVEENILRTSEITSGVTSIVELAPDLAVDIPLFYKYLGEILGPILADRTFSLVDLKDVLLPLIQFNKAGVVMAEALNTASRLVANPDAVNEIWQESGLTWEQLLDKGYSVDEFVKDKKLEYTLSSSSSHDTQSHASKIQEELLTILKSKTENKMVMNFIDENVKEVSSSKFIRKLTFTVCKSVIHEDDQKKCSCDKEALKYRRNVLLRYIDNKKELELQAAYALQQLVTDYNHPRGLLTAFFKELYDGDIITEDTFYNWESSKEFPDGKGNAKSDVKGFITWLREAVEESNEDEPTAATQ